MARVVIGAYDYHRCMTIDCCGDTPLPTDGPNLGGAVALFRSLADPARLSIIRRLGHGEARVADLVAALGLAQSTVSAHVGCLRGCGLVIGRPEGRQVFYSLARPELLDLLASAETLLAATGEAVALCPNYGTQRVGRVGDAVQTEVAR